MPMSRLVKLGLRWLKNDAFPIMLFHFSFTFPDSTVTCLKITIKIINTCKKKSRSEKF